MTPGSTDSARHRDEEDRLDQAADWEAPWRGWTADTLEGRDFPPRRWLLQNAIPLGTVTMFSGDGGGGKSFAMLQMSIAVVTDRAWLGHAPTKGNALYLSAEDDSDEVHRRLADICTFYGVSFADAAGLKVCDLTEAEDTLLATAPDAFGELTLTRLYRRLEQEIERWQPVLVTLDSLADFYGGGENTRSQVRQFLSALRRLAKRAGCAIVIISHPSLTGISSGSGLSGSTAWNNSVRSRLYLTKLTDEGADPDARVLSFKKSNYCASRPDLLLRRAPGGFELADAAAPIDRKAADEAADLKFMELLDAFTAEGRSVGDTNSVISAPKCFAHDPRSAGIRREGFKAAMGRLFAAGAIRVETSRKGSRHIVRTEA